jgi:hypothetical protein
MHTRLILILLITTLASCKSSPGNKIAGAEDQPRGLSASAGNLVCQEEDKEILERILEIHKEDTELAMSELMVKVGRFFLDTPYVAHTLESGDEEKLIINLRELDCTTFAENCLALARTIRSGEHSLEKFAAELLSIRYRDGVLEGYPSRLHYFCDWIHNNEQMKLITNVPEDLPQQSFHRQIHFMSTHPDSYRQLREDSTLVAALAAQEKNISSREMHYIPETSLEQVENQLKDGDIVGITTSIDGLAIQHVGILVRVEDRIHLLHASSAAKEVVLSRGTLEDYLLNSKSATGIMLARPL